MKHGFNVGDEVTFKARDGKTYDGKIFGVGLNLDYDISYVVNGKERYTFCIKSEAIKKR